MKALRFIVLLLLVIGGLNWGLYGFFQYDLVADLFGNFSAAARIVYGIVGIAGLLGVVGLFCTCRSCNCGNGSCGCCTTKNKKR
jgi:uncharacterized protein